MDLTQPLEREQVVAEVVAKSPTLARRAHRARALVHAGRAEGSLPSPELEGQIWNLPLERPYSLNEADMYMVQLRQRFPAAGSLDAKARALAEEAEAELSELASEEQELAGRARVAFAEYERAHRAARVQKEQLGLLQRMAEAARARFVTGGGLIAAAKIEVEMAEVRRSLARSQGDAARARAMLNSLLRRAPQEALGEPVETPALTVRLPVTDLLSRAGAERGQSRSAEARVRAAEARVRAAEAEARAPEWMVGVGYFQDPSMRPGFGLSASMTLPWLWGPGQHRVAQAREEEAAERTAVDTATLDAQADVTEAHARLIDLEERLRVLRSDALPTARRALDAVTAVQSTGGASLGEWVEGTRLLVELELEEVELEGELLLAVASLERAVGGPLPKEPLRAEVNP